MSEPTQIVARHVGVTSTPVTKVAAALVTLGCRPRAKDPVSNIYTLERPFVSARQPGMVFYHFEDGATACIPGSPSPQDLAKAWDANKAHIEFDAAFSALKALAQKQGGPILAAVETLEKLFGSALMCYLRAAMENRERLLDWWRKAVPMQFVKKGAKAWSLVRIKN